MVALGNEIPIANHPNRIYMWLAVAVFAFPTLRPSIGNFQDQKSQVRRKRYFSQIYTVWFKYYIQLHYNYRLIICIPGHVFEIMTSLTQHISRCHLPYEDSPETTAMPQEMAATCVFGRLGGISTWIEKMTCKFPWFFGADPRLEGSNFLNRIDL